MPFVHVELIEGRTEEQLTNMVKDITEAVSKNAGAPKENIHVIVNELKKRPLCTRRRMEKISFQRISVESLAFSENKWLNKCIND
ncbi:4-oxalocrotonate tautomerase [Enterococcus faecalis]|nr:4-oxalocrotonate tautomerase [Enterococcus faecalis]